MAGSDDLSGVAGYLLESYGNARCYDFTYNFITGLMLDTSYNGNISKSTMDCFSRLNLHNYNSYSASVDIPDL